MTTTPPPSRAVGAEAVQISLFGEEGPRKSAIISPCGQYRYTLTRTWPGGSGIVNFEMLNPSDADAEREDATSRKITSFAKRWGFGGYVATNKYAYRSTDPRELWKQADPVGPENDRHVFEEARKADLIVAAWGVNGAAHPRDEEMRAILRSVGRPVYCLRLTKDGHPWHPLYVPLSVELQPFDLTAP